MMSESQDVEMRPPPPVLNGFTNGYAHATPDTSEDEMPLSQAVSMSSPVMPPRAKRSTKRRLEVSSDEEPLASSPVKQVASAVVPMPGAIDAVKTNGWAKSRSVKPESDSEQETPLAKTTRKPPRKKAKREENSDVEDADSEDIKPKGKKGAARKRQSKPTKDSDHSEAEKTSKKTTKPRVKKAKTEPADAKLPSTPKKSGKKAVKDEDDLEGSPNKQSQKEKEEEEEMYRWWEQEGQADGSIKWTTLEHNGVLFPPQYEPLPRDVKMKYNGKELDLPPESEEVAGFYAACIGTIHADDDKFNENFFDDWKTVLKKYPPRNGIKVTSFKDCDFRPIYEHLEAEKAKRKAMTSAEKKEAKKQKDEFEMPYKHCTMDGRKEAVGNFRIEPPSLFRGRGNHPRKGALKKRVRPEDITLNLGKGAPIPKPNVPGNWGKIQHDSTVTWLANWVENVNNNHKYVFLAPGSSLKGQSDWKKFEKARKLKEHIDRIRQNYRADLKSKVMAERQRATAIYFIDKLALRAGNEKGDDEADTVGCCSLRCEHITLRPPNILVFDFLGKDSIRYFKEVEVEPQIFKNIRIFKDGKNDDDNIFDRLSTSLLNKHLTNEMDGLTAKVFRTYNASFTLQDLLDKEDVEGKSTQEKLNVYNKANRMVAILCNHHRSVPKSHSQSMDKLSQKFRGMKYDRMKLRHMLFDSDSKYKKDAKYRDDESDIDDDFIELWEDECKKRDIEKAEKKFAKDNEKREADGEKPLKPADLKETLDGIDDKYKKLKKERGTRKAAQTGNTKSDEKLKEMIDKLDERIRTFKLQMVDKEEGKEIALGTSKINYLDPRITVVWCRKNDVPIEKILSKSLLVKFPWAMDVNDEWKF